MAWVPIEPVDPRITTSRTPSHPDFVSAVGAATALAPVHEEIIILIVPGEAGGLDRGIPGQLMQRRVGGQLFAGGGILF